jgi:hypothetical protein
LCGGCEGSLVRGVCLSFLYEKEQFLCFSAMF